MKLLSTVEEYDHDQASKTTWGWFQAPLAEIEGLAYYRHPTIVSSGSSPPDLLLLARGYEPLAIRCLAYADHDIDSASAETWTVGKKTIESPLLQIDDFREALRSRFSQQRSLRGVLSPTSKVALPNATRALLQRLPVDGRNDVLFGAEDAMAALVPLTHELTDDQWRLAQAVCQSIVPLRTPASGAAQTCLRMGDAIQTVERDIALLDLEQEKAALQLPPGPQRIRGLAGTGKTVLLAMKAANIHARYPDRRILFTFHTRTLYRQVRSLISRFYRAFAEADPNWDMLHIRHAWGARDLPGVYSELCRRLGLIPMNLMDAKATDRSSPLAACCRQVLVHPIEPEYDHILLDEAQDCPPAFFQLLYALAKEPHAIYWAYDELQSLNSLKLPDVSEQFGMAKDGTSKISLDGEYGGGIEKDLVLQKSYRCPRPVLMAAHALGLGLYSKRGCVQIISDINSWRSVGYEIEQGNLKSGEHVVIFRPPVNSPNRIGEVYEGKRPLIQAKAFASRDEEVAWVSESIHSDINNDGVSPEHIVVVTLLAVAAKTDLAALQRLLFEKGIQSVIPGVFNDSDDFGAPGAVTLASVFRAKGNEAPVIYVMAAEMLGTYLNEVDARNKAFTAVSRSKGWVSITGSGPYATPVVEEVTAIQNDFPRFRFIFPDPDKIRRLDLETTRRKKAVRQVTRAVRDLISADPSALDDVDPGTLEQLRRRLLGDKDQ